MSEAELLILAASIFLIFLVAGILSVVRIVIQYGWRRARDRALWECHTEAVTSPSGMKVKITLARIAYWKGEERIIESQHIKTLPLLGTDSLEIDMIKDETRRQAEVLNGLTDLPSPPSREA